MVDIITPYALAILLLPVMAAWAKNPTRRRNVAWIMVWDGACLVGVVVWARATADYWPNWALYPSWFLWFLIGCGALFWTLLAMGMTKGEPPSKPPQPPMGEANYVSPTVYGSRARYQYKGSRAKKGRR